MDPQLGPAAGIEVGLDDDGARPVVAGPQQMPAHRSLPDIGRRAVQYDRIAPGGLDIRVGHERKIDVQEDDVGVRQVADALGYGNAMAGVQPKPDELAQDVIARPEPVMGVSDDQYPGHGLRRCRFAGQSGAPVAVHGPRYTAVFQLASAGKARERDPPPAANQSAITTRVPAIRSCTQRRSSRKMKRTFTRP